MTHTKPTAVAAVTARAVVRAATLVVASLAVAEAAFAQSSLPPGTTSAIPVPTVATGAPPFGATLLQEIRSPLFGTNGVNIISGSVTSAAFRTGSGSLDFYYQFTFDSNTNITVTTISLSSFTGVPGLAVAQTGEDVDGAGGLPATNLGGAIQNNYTAATGTGSYSSASRPNVNGDGINATLLTGVTRNETTFTFVIRTQATGFSVAGSASVQGGGISAFTPSQGAIAPLPAAAAPEPAAAAFFAALGIAGSGVAGIRAVRRRGPAAAAPTR